MNGPALAARGPQVAAAWFTRGKEDRPRVLLARSGDGGRTFGDPVTISTRDDAGGTEPLGHVGVALLEDATAAVLWLEFLGGGSGAEVRMRRVTPDGTRAPPLTVARTAASRAAGVPVVCPAPSGLLVAWTEVADPPRVRTARLAPVR